MTAVRELLGDGTDDVYDRNIPPEEIPIEEPTQKRNDKEMMK